MCKLNLFIIIWDDLWFPLYYHDYSSINEKTYTNLYILYMYLACMPHTVLASVCWFIWSLYTSVIFIYVCDIYISFVNTDPHVDKRYHFAIIILDINKSIWIKEPLLWYLTIYAAINAMSTVAHTMEGFWILFFSLFMDACIWPRNMPY